MNPTLWGNTHASVALERQVYPAQAAVRGINLDRVAYAQTAAVTSRSTSSHRRPNGGLGYRSDATVCPKMSVCRPRRSMPVSAAQRRVEYQQRLFFSNFSNDMAEGKDLKSNPLWLVRH